MIKLELIFYCFSFLRSLNLEYDSHNRNGDNTELGKKALLVLSKLGLKVDTRNNLNPIIKQVLDKSLLESEESFINHDDLVKQTKKWLSSKKY
ncbi:MAG: hypothetical protein ACOVO9_10290 [Bacteroidia bacterium]